MTNQRPGVPEKQQQILYSCYFTRNRSGEQFAPEHVFSYQVAGTLTINDGNKEYFFKAGDSRLSRRNRLLKFIKQPPANGEFKSLSVHLDQETLRNISVEYGWQADQRYEGDAIIGLRPDPLFTSYAQSLLAYTDSSYNNQLVQLKLKEAVLILLQTHPELKNVLFDFSEPGKTDLEAFMQNNYHFNVQLKRFAYLTGRSLATFKRDFEKIFHTTPNRWLQQKRLQEAHFLIKEKGKAPSDVHLDIGFEDLSHFSFAFKKMYGVAPSRV